MTTDLSIDVLQRQISTPELPIDVRQAMADGIIAVAAKAQDWPLMHEAIDRKIADQREVVAEWDRLFLGRGGDRRLVTERVTSYAAQLGINKMQVSRWRRSLTDELAYHLKIFTQACKAAHVIPPDNHRAMGTGENEWFTPGLYVEAAREVMGGIDLDPATHPLAQEFIQAAAYFIVNDDALSREWHGRVWLNPPYSRTLIEPFIAKLLAELIAERVTEAVLLTHSYTDTGWFHSALSLARSVCFTLGRVRFTDPYGEACNPTQGQVFFYYGSNIARFTTVFEKFGAILPGLVVTQSA